jgi:hypothetical protein
MFNRRNLFIFVFAILFGAAVNVPAQQYFADVENEVTKTLLKKDLRQAVKEAESSSGNDLNSLLRRLTLYRRAGNFEKAAQTIRQIVERPNFKEKKYQTGSFIEGVLGSEYFRDPKTIQLYLQKAGLSDFLYDKFVRLCTADRAGCDVQDFDRWLGQMAFEAEKSPEADKNAVGYYSEKYAWRGRRIDWRRKLGLDYGELTSRFLEDVRENPSDLAAAMRYIGYFRSSADALWLAENFTSDAAFGYYEVGRQLGEQSSYEQNPEERRQLGKLAVRFLLKSLATPYNPKAEAALLGKYRYYAVSMPSPKVINHEKQLRYWTKESLAENYKRIGEPQNAQPIVEELMSMDKSDIDETGSPRLAGAVQAASGARVVESEILRQQAARQDSYLYWNERIGYYEGRDEPELVFGSYMQGLAAVPFNLSDERSIGGRIFFIRQFADFVDEDFGQNANKEPEDDWDEHDRRRHQFWKEAESFLRGEFEKTKSNLKYSYELVEVLEDEDFDRLTGEILRNNPELLSGAARRGFLEAELLGEFLADEKIPAAKKDALFDELLKIADAADIRFAWKTLDAFSSAAAGQYAARQVPFFEKMFARSLAFDKTYKPPKDDSDEDDFSNLPRNYAYRLFGVYLVAGQRKPAGKLITDGYYNYREGMNALLFNAARDGAFEEALGYWKIKANLDRQDLADLQYLKSFPALARKLRDFYKQLKAAEPDSAIPDIALQLLG